MKLPVLFAAVSLASVALASQDIRRLSPILGPSQIPAQCRVASVLHDTPAEKAGIAAGDTIVTVNGQTPKDASALSELISHAPEESEFSVTAKDRTVRRLRIPLSASRPRLGAVCDLSGWVKPGVTAAGNESITLFDGPYALTASGIIDKGIIFLRVRVSNDSNHPLEVGPQIFGAADARGSVLKLLSPQDVMCMLYGDQGAHLLGLKKKRKETLDSHAEIPAMAEGADDRCGPMPTQGSLHNADSKFAEANAQYLAAESLWPSTYKPGEVADGLLYLAESASLPVTLKGLIEGRALTVRLGAPQASDKQMKPSELVNFFQALKKGNSARLTLKKGKVFVGMFASYDEDNERVWFNTPSGGILNSTSYSIEAIRYAEPLEQVPAKPGPNSDLLN